MINSNPVTQQVRGARWLGDGQSVCRDMGFHQPPEFADARHPTYKTWRYVVSKFVYDAIGVIGEFQDDR